MRAVSFAQDCVHLAVAADDSEWTLWRTNVRYDLKVHPGVNAKLHPTPRMGRREGRGDGGRG